LSLHFIINTDFRFAGAMLRLSESKENSFSFAECEQLRGVILKSRCKGTANFSFPQEGTFWWDSYQKVGIGMLSHFRENHFNAD